MSAHSLPESTNLWHGLEVDKALEMLDSDANSGLTSPEVEQRRQKYGLMNSKNRSVVALGKFC